MCPLLFKICPSFLDVLLSFTHVWQPSSVTKCTEICLSIIHLQRGTSSSKLGLDPRGTTIRFISRQTVAFAWFPWHFGLFSKFLPHLAVQAPQCSWLSALWCGTGVSLSTSDNAVESKCFSMPYNRPQCDAGNSLSTSGKNEWKVGNSLSFAHLALKTVNTKYFSMPSLCRVLYFHFQPSLLVVSPLS
jgi:hypothetical protein